MKKIIAIVAVIATITACFCIGANAYERGDTIEKGTVITFKEDVPNITTVVVYNINYKAGNEEKSVLVIQPGTNGAELYNSQTTGATSRVYSSSDGWIKPNYKRIEITEDFTFTDNNQVVVFNTVIQSASMPPLKQTIDNTKATFSTTLTIATAIIAWLMANQLALVGLYIYILVVLLATGKRFIKGA